MVLRNLHDRTDHRLAASGPALRHSNLVESPPRQSLQVHRYKREELGSVAHYLMRRTAINQIGLIALTLSIIIISSDRITAAEMEIDETQGTLASLTVSLMRPGCVSA